MAYAGATLLVELNMEHVWIRLPVEVTGVVTIPYIGAVPFLYAKLAVTLLLLFLGYGVLIMLYSGFYRAVGPSKYGPMDAPPPRRPRKKRRKLR